MYWTCRRFTFEFRGSVNVGGLGLDQHIPRPVTYGGMASFGLLTVHLMGQRYLLVVTG